MNMPNWITFARKISALEKRFVPLTQKIITAYRKRFISDLKVGGKDYAIQRLNAHVMNEPLAKLLQLIYRTAGLLGARMTSEELKKLAGQKAAGFGRNETWIRDVNAYLRLHMLNLVSDITDTMRDDILRILQKGVEEGWSIEQIVKELSSVGLIQARARVIARTEIVRAANVGHSVAAASLPYEVEKKWSAAHDERTRPSHKKIDGKTVEENEAFKVQVYKGKKPTGQYDNMQFPGDPTAHPSNTINCRCRALYIPKRDANGALIFRNPNQARVIPIQRVPTHVLPGQIAAELKSQIYIGIEK